MGDGEVIERPLNEREKLYAKHGGLCHYCGCQTTLVAHAKGEPTPKNQATIDHMVPKCRGGERRGLVNKVLACMRCNTVKSDMTAEEFVRAGLKYVKPRVLKRRAKACAKRVPWPGN